MCSICGGNIEKESIIKASNSMKHRGQDGSGIFVDKAITLAHNRLSIIDLSDEASQLMYSGNLVLIYDGELYNYVELKEELKRDGVCFHTTCDSAVLIVTANRSSAEYLAFIEGMVNGSFMQDSIKIVKNIIHEDIDKYISLSSAVISMAPSDGLPHTMLECLAARKFMIFRNLPQYEGFLEHQKSAFLVDNEQALVDAFLYVEKSESLDYTPSKEALSLIDKNILTKKYLSICKEIISSNGGAV